MSKLDFYLDQSTEERQKLCVSILSKTNDGKDLSADELLLVEHVVNNKDLTPYGMEIWKKVCEKYIEVNPNE